MIPGKDHIVGLIYVVKKLKYDNLKLDKLININLNNVKGNVNKQQLVRNTSKVKVKGKMELHMRPQENVNLEYPKDGEAQVNNTNKKNYRCLPPCDTWTFQRLYVFEIDKSSKFKTANKNNQQESGNWKEKPITNAVYTI